MDAFSINSSPSMLVSFCGVSKVMFCHLGCKKVIVLWTTFLIIAIILGLLIIYLS